jgi:hypothetical protein
MPPINNPSNMPPIKVSKINDKDILDEFYGIMDNYNKMKNSDNYLHEKDKYFRYDRRDYIKIYDNKDNKIFNIELDRIKLNMSDYHHSLALKLMIFKEKYISKYDLDYSKKHLNWYLNQNSYYYSIFYSFFYSKLNYPKKNKLKFFIDYAIYNFKNNVIRDEYKINKENMPYIYKSLFEYGGIYENYKNKNFLHNKDLSIYLYIKEINDEICVFELKISEEKIKIIKLDLNNIDSDENDIVFNYYLFKGLDVDLDFFENLMIKKDNKINIFFEKFTKNQQYLLELENDNLFIENNTIENEYIFNIANNIKDDFNFATFIIQYPNINIINNDPLLDNIRSKGYELYYEPKKYYDALNEMDFGTINEKLNVNLSMEKIIEKNIDVIKLLEYYDTNKIEIEKSIDTIDRIKYNNSNMVFLLNLNNIEKTYPNTTINIYIYIAANLINILHSNNIIYEPYRYENTLY